LEAYKVKPINNLFDFDTDRLIKESKEEGFRMIERLIADYKDGSNTFNNFGECLVGVFNEEDVLVAIGALNRDPFSDEQYVGRLRRFYVSKEYRRKGIGSLLAQTIVEEAKRYYKVLVLHTDTEAAHKFYCTIGFSKGNLYQNSSHYMKLKS